MSASPGPRRARIPTRRRLLESVLNVAYAGDWPARVWHRMAGTADISVARHRIARPHSTARPGRMAFISDLHIGPTTPVPLLERAFDIIRRAEPDVLLLGGDYVFLEATPARLEVLGRLVSSVSCTAKLAVLGNHDLWTDDRAIVRTLEGAGATVLVNQAVPLPEPWDDVVVVGLDDPWTGQCDAPAAFAGTNGEPVRVVLCHGPDGLRPAGPFAFDLFLCGHTHGGHVATPWGPVFMPEGTLCRQYPGGFARINDADVYVSRGIGGVEVPFRTFAPPDVLLIDL